MAIKYSGYAEQDTITIGSNQIAIVDGGAEVDTIKITADQTADVDANVDSTATIALQAGVSIASATTLFGTQIVTLTNGAVIKANAGATFTIGTKTVSMADLSALGASYSVTGNEAPADGTPATQTTLTTSDASNTLLSLDNMGTAMEITGFVQGESLINVVDIFTSLSGGFAGAEKADALTNSSVAYQTYGSDIIVTLEMDADGSVLDQTANSTVDGADITLKIVAPVDANGNAITTLTAADFEGLPNATVFTATIDYDTALTDNDDVAIVATATDINGLDLVDFGAGDDTLALNNTTGTTVLQTGNITGLENIASITANTIEIHDAFLAANTGNINIDTTNSTLANTVVDTENVSGTNTVTLTGTATATLADGAANSITIGDAGTVTTSTVDGGDDIDTITGGDRVDTIDGKAGADVIDGGAGNDEITGGAGADMLTGGAGADDFNYSNTATDSDSDNIDTIKDFVWSEDQMDFSALTASIANGFKTEGTINSVWTKDDGADVLVYVEKSGAWAAEGDEEMIIRLETPTKEDGSAVTASDINFLDFIGVSPFTAATDVVVGRTNDNTFTVSTAGTFDIDAVTVEENDTVDGDDGFDTITFSAGESDGTFIFSATEVNSVEAITVDQLGAATNITINNDFAVSSQGNGTDNSTDTDTVLLTVEDTSTNTLTLDTSDLTTGTVALAADLDSDNDGTNEDTLLSTTITLADTTNGNKNITVAAGAVASVTLTDADDIGLDEFTGGTGDDLVIALDSTIEGDVLEGGSNTDTGDTIDITTTAALTADNLANVTGFENFDIHSNNSTVTFSDNNVAAGQSATVTATTTTAQVTVDASAETNGTYEFDMTAAGVNTTTVNAANFVGKTTTFAGDTTGVEATTLNINLSGDTTLTAAELANVTDLDVLNTIGEASANVDITLSGTEVQSGDNAETLKIDATTTTTGNLTIDTTNEQDEQIITVSGTTTGDIAVVLQGVTYTQAVVNGTDTVTTAAAGLAAQINAATGMTATSEAGVITVTATNGITLGAYNETGTGTAGDIDGADIATALTIDASALTTGVANISVNQDQIATNLVLTGGDASDTLTVYGQGDINLAGASAGNISAIENLVLTQTDALTLTLEDSNIVDTKAMDIDATSMTGNLTFVATAEVDGEVNITAGSGDDTFKFDEVVFDQDAQIMDIDGGSGADVLQLTGATGTTLATAAMANVTNVETITAMTNGQAFALALHDNNAQNAGSITINTATIVSGAALTLDASAETESSVNFVVDFASFTDGTDVATGGDASDTLTIGGGTAANVANTNSITAIENIVLEGNLAHSFVTASDNVTGTNTLTIDATDVITSANAIVINATAETTGKIVSQVNATVNDVATVTIVDGGNSDIGDSVSATINGTTFTYDHVGGNETATTIAAGLVALIDADADYAAANVAGLITVESTTKTIGTITTAIGEVAAGVADGNIAANYLDTATITITNASTAGDADIVEAIIDGNVFTYDATGATDLGAGLDALIDAHADYSSSEAGGVITVTSTAPITNITTSFVEDTTNVDDAIAIENSTEALNGSTLTGGAGTDTVEISATSALVNIDVLGSAAITATEKVVFTTVDSDYDFTAADASATDTMTYDATALTTGTLTFNGALETSNVLNIFGGASNDILIGGTQNDVIRGGDGADTVTGGAGNDRFVFNTDDFDGSADVITDFSTTDEIYLEIPGAVDFNSAVMSWKSTGDFSVGTVNSVDYTNVTQVRKAELDNGDAQIQFDTDGDGVSDQNITLTGVEASSVTTDTFVFG